jgi:hypothetical protein
MGIRIHSTSLKEDDIPQGLCCLFINRQSAALICFGLRDVGILYSPAVIQRTVDVSPAFLEHGSAEKIAV